MIAKKLLLSTGLALSAVVGVSGTAQAASFTTNLGTNNSPTGDVLVNSVTQNGEDINLSFVETADIISNTGLTIGGASTDKGDDATAPDGELPQQNPTSDQLATYLGNNNLNNIADTEDDGAFVIDLTFEDPVAENPTGGDSLFFWERGLNSDITVQALDDEGNLIGNAFTITDDLWTEAGYSINTGEIDNAQPVGSYGVSFADLGLSNLTFTSIRVTSLTDYNGPDFKVAAGNFNEPPIGAPEPATILGLGSIAALAFVRRRQMKKGCV